MCVCVISDLISAGFVSFRECQLLGAPLLEKYVCMCVLCVCVILDQQIGGSEFFLYVFDIFLSLVA